MLEFRKNGSDRWINIFENSILIAQLMQRDGVWGAECFAYRIDNSNMLRQIADKLDELNHVN